MIRHGWQMGSILVFLVVSSLGFTGCAQKNGWSSFPVKIYADPTMVSNADQEADLKSAMSFWEAKAGKSLFDYQGAWSGGSAYDGSATSITSISANMIFFQNPWPFASTTVGETTVLSTGNQISSAVIMMNPSTDYCAGDCDGQDNMISQKKAFAHELGHFLGLVHVTDINDLMYPVLQPGGSLTSVTIDTTTFDSLVSQ